jgi:hypothetical protein
MNGRVRRAIVALAMAAAVMTACGDDSGVTDTARDAVDSAGARAQAEVLRGLLKQRAGDDAAKYRSIAVLQEAVADLPGDTKVSGISDGDGDGLDDDGKLVVEMNGARTCFRVEGTNTTVGDDAC